MPVRHPTSSDYTRFSTSGIPSMTALTLIWWQQIVTNNAGTNRTNAFIERTGDFAALRSNVSAGDVEQYQVPGAASATFSPGNPDIAGAWVMYAMTCDGTGTNGAKLYAWDASAGDSGYNLAQQTFSGGTTINIWGLGGYGSETRDARYCFVKIWDAALSLSELQTERIQGKPVRTSNLNRYHRLVDNTDTTDYSGNGRPVTFTGSPTTSGSEPVTWEVVASDIFYTRRRTIVVPKVVILR